MTNDKDIIADKFLTTNGVKLHYTVTGEGTPVILMHGWGCNVDTVRSIQNVAARRHKVYNIDFPGHGQSTEPPFTPGGKPWGVDEFTRLVEALAHEEKITCPILIGHSFGGRVSIVYASRNDVDKVVLVDAAGIKPRRSAGYYAKVYSFKLTKLFYRLLLGSRRSASLIEKARARRSSADYAAASPMMRAVLSRVVNEDLKHLMPAIKAPTLLLWGENDTATPLDDARTMSRLIPDAGLVSFPGAGHYSFLDNREHFNRVLDNFINT